MTKLLLKIFIKDASNTQSPQVKAAYGRMAGIICILCNILLFAMKLTIGSLSGSVSITADAFNNLSDASSNIISLIGFKIASKPADRDHPFGHARFEYISTLAVSVLMLFIALELAKSSILKLFSHQSVEMSLPFILCLVLSIAIKAWMAAFNKRLADMISSPVLLATSQDSRNDVISTLAVLVGAILNLKFKINIDSFLGIGVAIFIFISGISLIKDAFSLIIGNGVSIEEENKIFHKILSYNGVLGAHDLMVHDYGLGRKFGSVHVEMDSQVPPTESHKLIDQIEQDIKNEMNINIVIHYDPIPVGINAVDTLYQRVEDAVKSVSESISMHDMREYDEDGKKFLCFDVMTPEDFNLDENALTNKISEAINKNSEIKYICKITFDRGFAPIQK